MIASMTGFGRAESSAEGCSVTVELRSLNNRFLEVFIKLPRKFNAFEEDLVKIAKSNISRGKLDCTISLDGLNDSMQTLTVNVPVAVQYANALKELEKGLDSHTSFGLEHVLKSDDIFSWNITEEQIARLKRLVTDTFSKAIKELKTHKEEEGKNLAADLNQHINSISDILKRIQKTVEARHNDDYERLKKRILKVLNDVDKIDQDRIGIEIAYMAEKFDVAEECVRMESHLQLFRESLKNGGSVGRKLDFIVQEINREANTISSKSNNFDISKEVVAIKEEVDRLKEQIRNVE